MSDKIVHESGPLQQILEYVPKKFDLGVSASAMTFRETQKMTQSTFRMSDVLRMHTGLSQVEEDEAQDQVEKKTLERLKSVQEEAYKGAYQIGLEEGRKEAFIKAKEEIDKNLSQLGSLIMRIENLKSDLLKQNETSLVKLTMHVATRIAHHEVQVNNDCIIDILRQALEAAQVDEEVTVHVAPSQLEFLESLKKETDRKLEFLKKTKLVPLDSVDVGGCVIETNYGVIDARYKERLDKLWEALSESLYRVKDKIGAA